MDVNSVGGITTSKEAAVPGGQLGKDEFLGLLVAEMRNQDPLDPMNSRDTISQLAQFSALEQMQNVSEQVGDLRRESGLMSSMLLKGQMILAQTDGGEEISGIVEKVSWSDEGVTLTIGGENYSMKQLVSLSVVVPQA